MVKSPLSLFEYLGNISIWGGMFPFMKFQSTFIGENRDVDFLTGKQAMP